MATSSTGTISSTGLGSGLDVKSIVSQLVAIEKQPLTQLQTQATKFQTQLSTYGTIKSQVSTLYDAAALLSGPNGWNAQAATSSNAAAVGVTATTSAAASSLSVEVSQLARAQTSASVTVAAGTASGAAGSIKFDLGNWSTGSFVANGTTASVAIVATDTMATIASKVNAANVGVTATVLSDGTNERLVFKSSTTGTATGFRLNSPVDAGLAPLGLTNPGDTGFVGQTALDAKLKVNGVDVVSATNKMANAIPGITLQLSQVTTGPVDIDVSTDMSVVKKNIQSFVDAYNALNSTIGEAIKYDPATKVGGPLLGDSTTLGIQTTLRNIMGSASTGSTFSYLSDIGLERQTDGSIKINQTKLTSAQSNIPNLKALFAADNGNTLTNGFGAKLRDYTHGLINFDGMVTNKTAAVQKSISNNAKDQDRVTLRASKVEAQLLSQYSALDTKIAGLSSLNSYVTAQLAVWNKSTA
jgi:flagellar hook-associated protein 2